MIFEEKDFEAVELESTNTVSIQDFVDADQIDTIYYDTPYYLEPQKGGNAAYSLLRDVMAETGKVGIAKVAIRNREHLAAVKAHGALLVMELMHFAQEIAPADEIKVTAEKPVGSREKEMAKALLNQMTTDWEYADAVMKLIEQKIKAGGKEVRGKKESGQRATNVIDLVQVLQDSLQATGKSKSATAGAKKKKRTASHTRAA